MQILRSHLQRLNGLAISMIKPIWRVMRYIIGAILLFVLWLLMSGVYKPVTISLGAISCIFAVFIAARMNKADNAPVGYHLHPVRFAAYFGYLLKEIAISNWTVAKHILTPGMSVKPKYLQVPFTQKSELGQTIFANSITLTPGTLTVELGDGHFSVHALDFVKGDEDALADMDARVTKTESM